MMEKRRVPRTYAESRKSWYGAEPIVEALDAGAVLVAGAGGGGAVGGMGGEAAGVVSVVAAAAAGCEGGGEEGDCQ